MHLVYIYILVLGSRTSKEVEVAPARCCLSVDRRCGPFTNNDRYIGEIATNESEVGVHRGHVVLPQALKMKSSSEVLVKCPRLLLTITRIGIDVEKLDLHGE
jgi:hypothetical protein